MRRGLLDTDMLSYYLKGVPQVVERAREYLAQFGALEFSVVSYYEVRRGLEWAAAHRKVAEFEAFVGKWQSLRHCGAVYGVGFG
jgi:tRNA(fMet)-specific endonuclease VapC